MTQFPPPSDHTPPQQPAAGGQPWGQYPPMAPMPGTTEPIRRPREVDLSFLLWIAAIVVTVLSGIYNFAVVVPDAQNAVLNQTPNGNSDIVRNTVQATRVVSIVFAVIMWGLWVLFAMKLRSGKNWARVTLTVFTGLWLLSQVVGAIASNSLPSGLPQVGVSTLSWVFGAVIAVLVIAALVLMYRPNANPYFARR